MPAGLRLLRVAVSLAVLVLCWLALDDITTSRQPDYHLEYAMLAGGVAWFAGLTATWWHRRSGGSRT